MLHSLAVREKAYGPKHAVTARGLTNLAHLYERQSRPGEAFPLLLRSLEINMATVGPDHDEVTRVLILLAGSQCLHQQKEMVEAVEKFAQAAACQSRESGRAEFGRQPIASSTH